MSKNHFFTAEEKEFTEDSESNVEVNIMDMENNSEENELKKDESQNNFDKEITDEMVEGLIDYNAQCRFEQDEVSEYLRRHTIREHIYNNENGQPYMRMLRTDLTTSFIAQRFENEQWITRD